MTKSYYAGMDLDAPCGRCKQETRHRVVTITDGDKASTYKGLKSVPADHREKVASYVDDDASVAFRGSAPDGPGYWFPPTVLSPVSNDDRAAREEIFGPVAAVIPFDDQAEAVRIANDTVYGLSGSIWTRDGARALRVARALETGNISVNSNSSVRVTTPFGGFKQSGVGRELGPFALEHYTELKNVFISTE